MVRTVVSLALEDKRWLDRRAANEGVSMTELVRRAVQRMRAEEARDKDLRRLLKATAGAGRLGEDGLARQRRLRDEWSRRSA
jgi:hypothetical protein